MPSRQAGIAEQARVLFDAKAETWSAKYQPHGRLAGRLTQFSDALSSHVQAIDHVLDLGCGTGELARATAKTGLRVTACDISAQMLRRAAERDQSGLVDWVRLDPGWRRLPFEASTFDAIMAASVLEYVADPFLVLRECARVLRPGAVLLCTVPDPRHPVRQLERVAAAATGPTPFQVAARCPGRLGSYLTYLRISQHRYPAAWWHGVAEPAGLLPVHRITVARRPAPLQLLAFRATGCEGVR